MEVLLIPIAFLLIGFIIGYFAHIKIVQKKAIGEFNWVSDRLKKSDPDATFNFFPGINLFRPNRPKLLHSDNRSKAIDTLCVKTDDECTEIFGAYTRADHFEPDPYPILIPIKEIEPKEVVKFGEHFVELGNRLQEQCEKGI